MIVTQWSILAATVLSGMPVLAPAPVPTDRLEYRMGGVMSGPSEVIVDLVSGKISDTEPVYDPVRSAKTVTGKLSADQLELLRSAARTAIADGMETQDCINARKPDSSGRLRPPIMPIMDAIPSLSLHLEGRWAFGSAVITCWSKAANNLVTVLYQVAPKWNNQDIVFSS